MEHGKRITGGRNTKIYKKIYIIYLKFNCENIYNQKITSTQIKLDVLCDFLHKTNNYIIAYVTYISTKIFANHVLPNIYFKIIFIVLYGFGFL